MRYLLLLSLLPLCVAGGQHLIAAGVLDPIQHQARRVYVARAKATQVDLVLRLAPARRKRVLRQLVRELEQASQVGLPPASPRLLGALKACMRFGEAAECGHARELGEAQAMQARKALWWVMGYRVALGSLVGLVFVVCGLLLSRRSLGNAHARVSFGLAVIGAVVGLGGAARLVQRAVRQSDAVWVEGQRDFWITRARLALWLPSSARRDTLRQAADGLRKLGVGRESVEALRRACGDEDRLRALGRIYAEPLAWRPPSWIERWLLWIGAMMLVLVPIGRPGLNRPNRP